MIGNESNLFFYDRVEEIESPESPGIKVNKTFRDFINFGGGNVMRGIHTLGETGDDVLVVVMNDWREETFEQEVAVRGKAEIQKKKINITTQVPIEGFENVNRFFKLYDAGYKEITPTDPY